MPDERTYVVIGAPRGGTSLVSGALRMVGVDMGADIDPDNNEDRSFIAHDGDIALFSDPSRRSAFLEATREHIHENNARTKVWGWKDPLVCHYLEDLLPLLRNPRLILVTRDTVAVAMREWAEMPAQPAKRAGDFVQIRKVGEATDLYRRAHEIIWKSELPTLARSYERALRHSNDFATKIIDFAGTFALGSPQRNKLIKQVSAFARPDALTARLPSATGEVAKKINEDALDLRNFKSMADAYSQCAQVVNAGEYQTTLSLTQELLALRPSGFAQAPQLACGPNEALNFEGGIHFMRAIAHVNSGEPVDAYLSLARFFSTRQLLQLRKAEDPIVANLVQPATNLQVSVNKAVGG